MPMRRVLGLENLDEAAVPSVVTIGKFFALHRGHRALLEATVRTARERRARSVVLTFDRHPLEILRPGLELPVLASLEERLAEIEASGLDLAVVIHVTAAFLGQEPEEFVRAVLLERLGTTALLAGENFRFGRGARGDMDLLSRLGEAHGFDCLAVPPVMEGGEPISSSRVGECLAAGRVAEAAVLLGRPYAVPGVVVAGERLGTRLGFPTANVRPDPRRLLPADGVYVAAARIGGALEPAVANLGVRPTVDGRRRVLEAHLLDAEIDLYGQRIALEFRDRLRDERRFPTLEALREQIARDADAARRRFRGS